MREVDDAGREAPAVHDDRGQVGAQVDRVGAHADTRDRRCDGVAGGREPVLQPQPHRRELAGGEVSGRTEGPLRGGREHRSAGVVANRDAEARVIERGVDTHLDAHGDRFAVGDRDDPRARGILEPGVDDVGVAVVGAPVIVAALVGKLMNGAPEVQRVVAVRHIRRVADRHHAALLEQHRAVAEALDRAHVVRHEEDRAALLLQPEELVEALLLEAGVADREHLVDQQHVGIDLDRDREREAHRHARGVVLQPHVEEVLELGEGDDRVEARLGLLAREAEHDRVEDHVVARREVDVEADAQLDERRQPAAHVHPAGVDVVDPGQALQQRALAAAVAPDDAEELAPRDVHADVVDGPQQVEGARLERVQGALLQRVVLAVVELEGLARVLDRDSRQQGSTA